MKFRRRRYLTNAGLQMKFIISFVLVSLLGNIAAAAAFNFFALEKLETLMGRIHISAKTTGELITPLLVNVNIISFLFVSALLTITAIWMIRKVTGPLYRMSQDIMRIANGDLSAGITLRQKDELQDIAQEINFMVESIREKFRIISEKHVSISKTVAGFKEKTANTETLIKDYNSVLKNIESLETDMNSFKLSKSSSS